MEIRRQADTHNPGNVTGAAPVRHQVRSVDVRLETLPEGLIRVSTPQARGWSVTARTRDDLARAIQQAFTEAQVASYAAWRGEAYDLDAMTEVDNTHPLTAATRTRDFTLRARSDVHNPDDWTPMPDGRWRSPGGRLYGADTDAVRKVLAKRRRRPHTG
jgi:hypothetical protein